MDWIKEHWEFGWNSIAKEPDVPDGLSKADRFSVRTIAALRQLVQRNWNRQRVCNVIDGMACALHNQTGPEKPVLAGSPLLPFGPYIWSALKALLDANMDIREAEFAIKKGIEDALTNRPEHPWKS
jgi:hypothetical protein